jgi:AraC family transcriptional activator of pobA
MIIAMRPARREIPSFSLYGEPSTALDRLNVVHIEDIPSRSSKYLGQIGSHRHFTLCQCIVVTAGPVIARIEESQSTSDYPMAVIVPAGTVHSFRFREETRGFVLTVNLDRLSIIAGPVHQALIESLFLRPRTIDLQSNQGLAARTTALLDCLLRESRQPEGLPETIGGWLACCALLTLAAGATSKAASEPHGSADFELLRAFRSLVEGHYTAHWAIERYARELGISETSLNRLCRRLTGSTGFDLIQQRLALEARRRLSYSGGSISSVANELGFKDSAYFSRFFRRHGGVSPAEFRRRRAGGKVPTRISFVQ